MSQPERFSPAPFTCGRPLRKVNLSICQYLLCLLPSVEEGRTVFTIKLVFIQRLCRLSRHYGNSITQLTCALNEVVTFLPPSSPSGLTAHGLSADKNSGWKGFPAEPWGDRCSKCNPLGEGEAYPAHSGGPCWWTPHGTVQETCECPGSRKKPVFFGTRNTYQHITFAPVSSAPSVNFQGGALLLLDQKKL